MKYNMWALRNIMHQRRLTQTALAEKSHLHRSTIAALLVGRRDPTPFTLNSIARALDMKPNTLEKALQLGMDAETRETLAAYDAGKQAVLKELVKAYQKSPYEKRLAALEKVIIDNGIDLDEEMK